MILPSGTHSISVGFLFAQLGMHLIEKAKVSTNNKTKEYIIGVATLLSVPAIYPIIKFFGRKVVPFLFEGSDLSNGKISAQKARMVGFTIGVLAYYSGFKLHEHIELLNDD